MMELSILVLLCLMLMAALASLIYLGFMLKRRTNRIESSLRHLHDHVWNTAALHRLVDTPGVMPMPSGWAAASDVLGLLGRIASDSRTAVIVELGSGLSTVVMASALQRSGHGVLVSIDHDEHYAQKTREALRAAGVADHVEVRVAPLKRVSIDGCETLWYDLDRLQDLRDVDCLFVDGPPATISPDIRGPALSYFWPRLSPGGVAIFDDAARPSEHEFIDRWVARHQGVHLEWLPYVRGCALVRRSD